MDTSDYVLESDNYTFRIRKQGDQYQLANCALLILDREQRLAELKRSRKGANVP